MPYQGDMLIPWRVYGSVKLYAIHPPYDPMSWGDAIHPIKSQNSQLQYQWSFLVPFIGWDRYPYNHPIGSIYHLYTTYK